MSKGRRIRRFNKLGLEKWHELNRAGKADHSPVSISRALRRHGRMPHTAAPQVEVISGPVVKKHARVPADKTGYLTKAVRNRHSQERRTRQRLRRKK